MGSTATRNSDPVPPRPTHVRYLVLACAAFLALMAYVLRLSFSFLAPDLKQSLHLDVRQVGYLMAVWLYAYGAFEVPWGVLGDRYGVRHLLTLIGIASALLTGAVALVVFLPADSVQPFLFLFLLRGLFGFFQAGLFPQISRMMTDWLPQRERATGQGIIWMASRFGGALAPFLLAALTLTLGSWSVKPQLPALAANTVASLSTPGLDSGVTQVLALKRYQDALTLAGWPRALWVLAALGSLGGVVFWLWFRNRPAQMKRVNAAELEWIAAGRPPAAPGPTRVPWGRILRSPSVWALCGLYGCGGFAANFFVTFLPTYLRDHRHLTPDVTKWLSSLPLACGIPACLLGGVLSDAIIRHTGNRKWGRRLSGMVGAAGAGLALLSTIWVQDVVALGVLLCLAFFCNDLGMGPAWAACSDVGERFAGTVGGKMNMIGNIAGGVGSMVVGHLLHTGQVTLVFVVFACSFWLGALCWLSLDVTRPITAEKQ
jgi:ACS family glucarate transporter-like MFS transporter